MGKWPANTEIAKTDRILIRLKKWLLLVGAVVFLSGLVLGSASAQKELSGKITEAGSTSVLPLAEAWALRFMELHPKVTISYAGGGSGAGVTQVAAGTVDIGAISRELKPTELAFGLETHLIARDGQSIIVHRSNPIEALTIEEVAKIFSGEIQNWSELGWRKGGKIHCYAREEGSGTRDFFEEAVMKKRKIAQKKGAWITYMKSNGEIQAGVSGDRAGIGFVALGYISGVKVLKIKKTPEAEAVAPTIENCQKGTYPLVRNLYFLTKGRPKEPVKSFIDFALSEEGQRIARKLGYLPLPR